MKFNKNKYFELIQNDENLENINKVKLKSYSYLLDDYAFWQNKYDYYQMFQLFVNEIISIDELRSQFFTLRNSNLYTARMRKKNFKAEAKSSFVKLNSVESEIDYNCKGFENIISTLHDYLDLYNPDVTLDMEIEDPELIGYSISEEGLKIIIKNRFLPKISQYWKKG